MEMIAIWILVVSFFVGSAKGRARRCENTFDRFFNSYFVTLIFRFEKKK